MYTFPFVTTHTYLPLVTIFLHVSRTLLTIVNMLEGVVSCGDSLWILNLVMMRRKKRRW